jgi:hypothetical protein
VPPGQTWDSRWPLFSEFLRHPRRVMSENWRPGIVCLVDVLPAAAGCITRSDPSRRAIPPHAPFALHPSAHQTPSVRDDFPCPTLDKPPSLLSAGGAYPGAEQRGLRGRHRPRIWSPTVKPAPALGENTKRHQPRVGAQLASSPGVPGRGLCAYGGEVAQVGPAVVVRVGVDDPRPAAAAPGVCRARDHGRHSSRS